MYIVIHVYHKITNKYYMILSTRTRVCVILNVHISTGFKYHEYYLKRCLTGNYMFSSEHEISDIKTTFSFLYLGPPWSWSYGS